MYLPLKHAMELGSLYRQVFLYNTCRSKPQQSQVDRDANKVVVSK